MVEWMILFLCGDVMTGRGIDQALPYSVDPQLHERYVQSAQDYIRIAERKHGRLDLPLKHNYIWGDALAVLEEKNPVIRIINLETSITTSDEYWRGKGIHYRMHPQNTQVLLEANIDACSLANNHVLDWGYTGLNETLASLQKAGIKAAGAGENAVASGQPAIMPLKGDNQAHLYAVGGPGCGIPSFWAAKDGQAGVYRLPDLHRDTAQELSDHINAHSSPEDLVILSIHWGDNWGYEIPDEQIRFAHQLIDNSHVDLIHGHSSHHVRPFEVYNGKLILYGCGDFINDYEGITSHERFRGDLSLMFFPKLETNNWDLLKLELVPMQIRRFSLKHARKRDVRWIGDTLNRICEPFQIEVEPTSDNTLILDRIQS